jgi:preprotein translocase subunit SecG
LLILRLAQSLKFRYCPPFEGEIMDTFVAVIHVLVALILVALVLVQDSKSGSLGGAFGGGGSNSVFGATGATTLAQKITRWVAVIFASTSILLSVFSARQHQSVMDGSLPAASAPMTAPTTPAPTTPVEAPAAQPNK